MLILFLTRLPLKWPFLYDFKKWPQKVWHRNDHDKLVLTSNRVDNRHWNKPTAVFWQKVHFYVFFRFTSSDIKKTHFDIRLWSFRFFLDLFLCGFFSLFGSLYFHSNFLLTRLVIAFVIRTWTFKSERTVIGGIINSDVKQFPMSLLKLCF